jgi:hypothetical protein
LGLQRFLSTNRQKSTRRTQPEAATEITGLVGAGVPMPAIPLLPAEATMIT